MAGKGDNYIVSKMGTVLIVPIDALKEEQDKINLKVEAKVKEIVNKLKLSHAKFEDPDFGPLENDEFGAKSLYGNGPPNPAGSKYPAPESLMWQRPQYDDNNFSNGKTGAEDEEEEEDEEDDDDDEYGFKAESNDVEIWCKHGNLFLDGSSSGDVIQGQLGDCWFLSALAVMGAHEKLLTNCFWNRDSFKEHGVYVLRFYKDTNIIFIIIDDRIPVKAKDGRVIFAGNKDPNELWVPLIEKGYAKLHGCYKALIGGYTHYGLADMTGYCPRLIVTRKGYTGYSVPYSEDDIWKLLLKYKEWNCLMGCSIQSNPKENVKVEAKAGMGLHMGHAYSLLDVGTINTKGNVPVRLLKIRNPWGRGEWEGAFGDNTPERQQNASEIDRVFFDKTKVQAAERVGIDANDGTFFMTVEDWMKYYTSLFVAIRFPDSWCGKRSQGAWKGDCGGNRKMGSWMSNPHVKLRIEKDANGDPEYRQVFVGLYIKDSRLTLGANYIEDPLYASGLSFDIVTVDELSNPDPKSRETIPTGRLSLKDTTSKVAQPPYNYGATQVEVFLQVEKDYYIVPSLANRGQSGPYFLNVYVDAANFHLDGAVQVSAAQKPMEVGKPSEKKALKMSVAQFYEKKEMLRERIVAESKRLGLSISQIEKIFNEGKSLAHGQFKKRMMDMGFSLADFPDDDLIILDMDNDGTISAKEFVEFFKEGIKFVDGDDHQDLPAPQPPIDDLMFKSTDLEGELCVNVFGARNVREATTWFNSKELAKVADAALVDDKSKSDAAKSMIRTYIKYDPKEAATMRAAAIKERAALLEQALAADRAKKNPPTTKLAEIKTDVDEDPVEAVDTFSPDKTHKPGDFKDLKDFKSVQNTPAKKKALDGDTVITTMSTTLKEVVNKAGSDAADKLHTDNALKIAEISRTKSLGALRSFKRHKETEQASASAVVGPGASAAGEGVLRKKTAVKEKVKRRDITQDKDAMAWLNYRPAGVAAADAIPVRQPLAIGGDAGKGGAMASATVGKTTTDSKEPPAASVKRPALTKTLTSRDIPLNEVAFLLPDATKGAGGAAGKVSGPTRYREVVSDLWDYLVDCVITISVSRPKNRVTDMNNSLLGFKRRKITADSFLIFNPIKSPLPAPVAGASNTTKTGVGHAPTPKNARRTPGQASVTTLQAVSKQKNQVLDAKEKLKKIEEEQKNSYEEIYRRLVLVPTTTAAELEGDGNAVNANLAVDSNAYLKSLFKKFDKNLNGTISKDEFQLAMTELNIDVSAEDCNIFFSRFGTKNSAGLDWIEFLNFFSTKILGSTNAASTNSSNKKTNLVDVLIKVKTQLFKDVNEMTEKRIASLETYFTSRPTKGKESDTVSTVAAPATASSSGSAKVFVLPDNAIFQNLQVAQAKENAEKLKKLGVTVTEEEMARISRIFLQNVSVFMNFIRLPELDLHAVLDISDLQLSKGISLRSGLTAGSGGLNDLTSSVTKLWNSIAPNVDSAVQFDDIASYFSVLLCEGLDSVPGNDAAKATSASTPAAVAAHDAKALTAASTVNLKALTTLKESATLANLATKPAIQGVNADILCRIITDSLIYSNWNRVPPQAASQGLLSTLSFSGLDAYVRNERINYIDRKLKYLMQLEANFSSSATYLMVHAYISRAQDELIILGHDAIMGDVYKLSIKENLSHLPVGEKCSALFPNAKKDEETALKLGGSKVYNSDSVYLYNPWDTPAEDRAISEFVNRLRVVRGRSAPSHLIIAEEPQFITTLKTILDTSTLPFFSVLNELTLSFSVDVEATKKTSLRGAIFGSIRSQKALYSFIVNVSSSLNVVLSTYNSDIKEAFKWTEMLAHMTNYRNPFVTVQLLPKFVEPEDYIYVPHNDESAFAGDEEADALAVKKGPVAYDGAPHPTWNCAFKFSFQPPRLTNCKVLCTEIAKLKIENAFKYVIVMVRQSKKTVDGKKVDFRFLTIYDPRSATEYQCGVKPGCKLHECLFKRVGVHIELDKFMEHVGDAADKDLLILGPAITPRIVINLYNHNGRSDELLGSCQVSISAVLSGSGVSDKQWVTMTYKTENANGKAIDDTAGDVELELGFRKQAEIDAEKESDKKHAEKKVVVGSTNKVKANDFEPIADGVDVKQMQKRLVEQDKRIKELTSSHDTITAEFVKLKDVVTATNALAGPVHAKQAASAAPAVSGKETPRTPVVDEKAVKELAAAKEEAKKLAAEKAAMEKQVKDLQEKLENATKAAAKNTPMEQPVGAANPESKLSKEFQKLQEAHDKLLRETEELRQLKAAMAAGAAGGGAAAVAATAPTKKKSPRPEDHVSESDEPEKVPLTSKRHSVAESSSRAAAPGKTKETAAAVAATLETPQGTSTRMSVAKMLSSPSEGRQSPTLPTPTLGHSESAVELINITDTSLDGIIHSILKILVARNDGNRKTALEGFQSLLFCHAKPNAEMTHKDIIAALGDLMINISTEQSILMVREIVPKPSQPVTVASIIDLFNNGMLSLPAVTGKGKKRNSSVGESTDSLQFSDSESQIATSLKYPEMIRVIVTSLSARHEKRGLHGGNVINGLQKLLVANSKAGLLSDKKMSEVLKILMFEVSAEQCARLMKALDPSYVKSAPVEDIVDVFKDELSKIPKPLAAAATVSSPAKRRPTAHQKAGETQQSVDDVQVNASIDGPIRPKAERPSSANPTSSVDKTVRAPPSIGALHSKSSGNMTATEGRTASSAGEIDWSKEPLPEGWERKRLAKNNKLVYVNKQLEEIRWQHPNDTSKPKPKKSSDKDKLNKTADSGVPSKKAAASAVVEESEKDAVVVDEKAKTLPLPKKKTTTSAAVSSTSEKEETSSVDRGSNNAGEDGDDEL